MCDSAVCVCKTCACAMLCMGTRTSFYHAVQKTCHKNFCRGQTDRSSTCRPCAKILHLFLKERVSAMVLLRPLLQRTSKKNPKPFYSAENLCTFSHQAVACETSHRRLVPTSPFLLTCWVSCRDTFPSS